MELNQTAVDRKVIIGTIECAVGIYLNSPKPIHRTVWLTIWTDNIKKAAQECLSLKGSTWLKIQFFGGVHEIGGDSYA